MDTLRRLGNVRPEESGKLVYPGEPDYPVDRYRFLGTIDVRVEVVYDGNGEHLAEDMSILVERALEERGCEVLGGSHGMTDLPHCIGAGTE